MEKPKLENISEESRDITNNSSLVEKRSGFSPAAKEAVAKNMLSYIEKEITGGRVSDEGEVEAKIYNYLTHRKTVEELKALDKKFSAEDHHSYAELVEDIISSLAESEVFKIKGKDGGSPWSHVWYENKFAMQKKNLRVSEQENVEVSFKQYFTFVPLSKTHEGVFEEMNKFIQVIPELAKKLRLLGLTHVDEIELKVPNNILFFISHPDSLVVHFRNERIAGDVRRAVDEICKKHGITITRKGRAEAGFDFRSNKGKQAYLSGSHSELIAKAIAKDIARDIKRNKSFAPQDSESFLAWFDGEVETKGKLSPEDMLKHLEPI